MRSVTDIEALTARATDLCESWVVNAMILADQPLVQSTPLVEMGLQKDIDMNLDRLQSSMRNVAIRALTHEAKSGIEGSGDSDEGGTKSGIEFTLHPSLVPEELSKDEWLSKVTSRVWDTLHRAAVNRSQGGDDHRTIANAAAVRMAAMEAVSYYSAQLHDDDAFKPFKALPTETLKSMAEATETYLFSHVAPSAGPMTGGSGHTSAEYVPMHIEQLSTEARAQVADLGAHAFIIPRPRRSVRERYRQGIAAYLSQAGSIASLNDIDMFKALTWNSDPPVGQGFEEVDLDHVRLTIGAESAASDAVKEEAKYILPAGFFEEREISPADCISHMSSLLANESSKE